MKLKYRLTCLFFLIKLLNILLSNIYMIIFLQVAQKYYFLNNYIILSKNKKILHVTKAAIS